MKIIDNYDYLYELREIQNEYMPELSEKALKKRGRPKKVLFVHRERSLYYTRLQDLIKLCELREYNLKGHRELILFLYRYYSCYFTEDIEKALHDTLEVNSMFRQPLSEKEVIRATRSAEIVYKDQNKNYKYKNETLINLLEISDIEQKEMLTIISKDEYRRRKRERNNKAYNSEEAKEKYKNQLKQDGKLTKKEQIELQREKIKSLREEGFKNKEISQKLNIVQKILERHITYMKKNGLL